MQITNKYNIPEAIVNAVKNDSYSKGDAHFSVTELLRPGYMAQLQRDHHGELSEDASDRIYSLLGQATHVVLERAAGGDIEVEKRLQSKIDDAVISGQVDVYDNGVIQDYKIASVYEYMDPKPERALQLNMYAWLLRQNGYDVTDIQAVYIFRDWSKMKALRSGGDYPPSQVAVKSFHMMPNEKVVDFIRGRIENHLFQVHCNSEDRWRKDEKWAVMQKGKKRAVKLHDNESEAQQHAENVGGYVEYRAGEDIRCEYYCNVSHLCEIKR